MKMKERTRLFDRVSGEALLNALNLIDDIKVAGGKVDEYGYATVFHTTDEQSAKQIKERKIMIANEDGVYFSSSIVGQSEGDEDSVIKLTIPVEKLIADDIFDEEIHLKYPVENNKQLDVSDYLFTSARNNHLNSVTGSILKTLEKEIPRKLENAGYMIAPLNPDNQDDRSFRVFKGTEQIGRVLIDEDVDFASVNYNPQYHKVNRIVCDTVDTVRRYFNAPELNVNGVEGFKKITEFDDVVLAGKYNGGNRGFTWVTWHYDYDRKGVCHGNYFDDDFTAAKENYYKRAGFHKEFLSLDELSIVHDGLSTYISQNSFSPQVDEVLSIISKIEKEHPELVPEKTKSRGR